MQRERGEVAIEGVGTLDLTATERDGMHRIDVRELNPALQSLARLPVLSAFRYQRSAGPAPGLALDGEAVRATPASSRPSPIAPWRRRWSRAKGAR